MYLAEIERSGEVIPAVGPRHALSGATSSCSSAWSIPSSSCSGSAALIPATNQVFKLHGAATAAR